MNRKALRCILASVLLLQTAIIPASAIHSTIKVGFNKNFAPYQFIDDDGNPSGFHIDIMKSLGTDVYTMVEYIAYDNDRQCIQALEEGDVDIALGVTKAAGFGHAIDMTNSLSSSNLCLIAPNDIAKRREMGEANASNTVAIEDGQLSKVLSIHKVQNEASLGNSTFLCLDSHKKVVDYLVERRVDYAVCEKNCALYLLDQYGCQNDYTIVFNYLTDVDFYMALRSTDQSLLLRMNEELSNLRGTGKYSHLFEKWIVTDTSAAIKQVIRIAVLSALVAAVAVLIYFFASRRLRVILQNRIAEQTQELQSINDRLEKNLSLLKAESAIRYQMIEDSPSGMLMFTDGGKIVIINKKACELLSVSKETCMDAYTSQIAPLHDILLQVNRRSQNPSVIAYKKSDKKGLLRCSIYQMPEEEPRTWLLSFEDVTQEERNKQEQIEADKNRILNAVIAGISHEIKNPLTAIKTYAEVLKEQQDNPAFMESFTRYVPAEVERINKLVESLLNYSRPAKGVQTRVVVMPMLKECIGLLNSLIKKAGAHVICEGDSTAAILAYQDGLRQAIINYLMNAVDSVEENYRRCGEAGEILVRCERNENRCTILIRDNGIGMTTEQLQRCMEPFYTRKTKGTGIGMSIALQAIRDSNGSVSVDSELGNYTVVNIEFEVDE